MDKNIDFKNFINNITKIGENNTFFKELIGLSVSNDFNKTEDMEEMSENKIQSLNITEFEPKIDETNFSFQLLSDQELETKLTPSLDVKTNVSKRTNLFGFHKKKQLFENNFCLNDHKSQEEKPKENLEAKDNCQWNNTLGLSPVKKDVISDISKSILSFSNIQINADKHFEDLSGVQVNSFSSNDKQIEMESILGDNSFKSLSKCSDLELRAEGPKLNETFRSPNSECDNKSIASYFKQRSEPISSFKSVDNSFGFKTISGSRNDSSVLNESFASVFNEIDSSNNTLDLAQKLIDRKHRKRKSDSMVSLSSAQEIQSEQSFTPSINSTLNSCEDFTDKESPDSYKSKSVVTSGLGTMTTLGKTYSMPNISGSQSIGLSNGSALNLNQLLFISPNVLSLTMGCFIEFKLNYLIIRNLSITSFRAEIKLQTNADTLNNLQIDYPKSPINIPAFYDGFLSDQITIIPLKSGSFSISFQIYISIEGINLPISPMSVICHIKAEEVVIKRPLFVSKCLEFDFHLFEDNIETQTIDLCVSNRHIINEIPLKMCLEPNKCIVFEPIYRHPDSSIHTFRCPDPNTLFLVTKTQYEMRIPIRIQSFGVRQIDSCLTVSTDSMKSHVLAIFSLRATFWPKRELTEQSIQCSKTSISLKTNEWKEIHFRNKSKENLIRISFKCIGNERPENLIKLSTSQLMIPPLKKLSIAIMAQKTDFESHSKANLMGSFDSGFGKSFQFSIPIQITSNK